MSDFKDMVEADIRDVFINAEEFAETHVLNDVELMAVLTVDRTKRKSEFKVGNYDGLHGDFATLYFKKSEYPRVPKHNENITLDGKRYKVENCNEEMGVLCLVLAAYRMGGAG